MVGFQELQIHGDEVEPLVGEKSNLKEVCGALK